MHNYPQLLLRAFKNAWSQKSIWFLGLVQIFCLFLVLRKLNPLWWVFAPRVLWLLGLMSVFSMASVILWLKVEAFEKQKLFILGLNAFLQISIRLFGLLALAIAFAVLLKALHFYWTLFSVISSLSAVGFTAAMLAAVLYRLSFYKSLGFMINFWKAKISLVCAGAFAIMLGNAYAFYWAHEFLPQALSRGAGFSVSGASATIWVVFFILAGMAAFFSAVVNAFLVLLFLSLAQVKKEPEKLRAEIIQAAVNI